MKIWIFKKAKTYW